MGKVIKTSKQWSGEPSFFVGTSKIEFEENRNATAYGVSPKIN